MDTITINNLKYPIIISSTFNDLYDLICRFVKSNKILIITDINVDNLYSIEIISALLNYNFIVNKFTILPGEDSKNLITISSIYQKCLECNLDRNDCVIALGGGVIGDITGFVAATYLRGINFIQIPTTVISQVDSSIGGKTGVNFNGYKNIIGSFYNPSLVYINVSTISSLKANEYLSGLAEVIKYGIIKDSVFFEYLLNNIDSILSKDINTLKYIVHRCCQIKSEIVSTDEKENGVRIILNFGHTIGHAIESASNFKLSHGECIVLGIIAVSKLSLKLDKISYNDYQNIYSCFSRLGIIKSVTNISIEQIAQNLKYDKKIINGRLRFIIPIKIGNTEVIEGIDQNTIFDVLVDMGFKSNS